MNRRSLIAVTGLAVVIGTMAIGGVGGCRRSDRANDTATAERTSPDGNQPLQVVVSVGMLADLVREIGGQHTTVVQLMGEGVDPHLYKINRDDVRAIVAADMLFVSGLMLEGKMLASLEQLAKRIPVISVADRLAEQQKLPVVAADEVDPHVWMDLSLWAETLPIVVAALSEQRPEQAAEFQQRADRLREDMLAQHRYGLQVIATIPEDQRYLITSHDAFAYFGRAYGLKVTGVQGLSTESEAGLHWINQLVDLIVQQRVRAVFVESSVPRKSMEAVLEGVRSRQHQVEIGGELYSDSAGAAGSYEGTYLGMMDHNLTLIARALGGQAPADGFRGRLQREPADGQR